MAILALNLLRPHAKNSWVGKVVDLFVKQQQEERTSVRPPRTIGVVESVLCRCVVGSCKVSLL